MGVSGGLAVGVFVTDGEEIGGVEVEDMVIFAIDAGYAIVWVWKQEGPRYLERA